MSWLAIGLGGAIGAIARAIIGQGVVLMGFSSVIGTLSVNIIGCFGIGYLWAASARLGVSEPLLAGAVVGFLGAFTTFSAFAKDGVLLAQSQNIWVSLGYLLATQALGILAVLGAYRLGSL